MNDTMLETAVFHANTTLEKLNSEEAVRRLPVVFFILVLMIIGIFGNVHVLFIYFKKFSMSTYRVFVLSLGIIDITSCCISMPFEIADELNPYNFDAAVACKLFRFVNTCLAMASSLMLVVIASERYRRICNPYGNQMTENQARYALTTVVFLAICSSLPAVYIYGRKTIDIPRQTVKGTECTWSDEVAGSAVGYAYYAWGILVIILCMVLLVVLYSLVGLHLRTHTIKVQSTMRIKNHRRKSTKSVRLSISFRHLRRKKACSVDSAAFNGASNIIMIQSAALSDASDITTTNRQPTQSNPLEGMSAVYRFAQHRSSQKDSFRNGHIASDPSNDVVLMKAILNENADAMSARTLGSGGVRKIAGNNYTTTNITMKQELQESDLTKYTEIAYEKQTLDCINRISEPVMKNTSRRGGTVMCKNKTFISDREQRITKVLFTITLLFIFSFLPYIVILIVYSADATYEQKLTPGAHVVYLMGLRLYFINNIANSILYILFDLKFRKIFVNLYKNLFT